MHGSHWSLRAHAARPPPTADRTEPDQRERVCETFVRRAFQILPFTRKDGRRHCFEKRSVILSHLKYEIERIRHDPHDELLKSSPFCSEPAAPVSITCQETPNRTASPFDELASRTNDIIDRKRFPCDRKSSPVLFAVTRQCFRATRNLSRYCNWCSLDCVHEIDLPDFTVAYSPRNHSS